MRRHCVLSHYRRSTARRARLVGAMVLAGLVALPSAAAATGTIDERLGAGLPLVLKDGRIANVTVHTIPFATGADTPDAETAASLEATFRPLATDCFLTAQAIGHVAPGITRDGDTLAAHRLARARADGIQGVLAGFGMPQPAVASVWDWQFLVQESQVTLWVFSLNVGDDCDGTPLPIEAPALAAADDAPTEAPSGAGEAAVSTSSTAAIATPSTGSTGPIAEGPRETPVRPDANGTAASGTARPLTAPPVAATASPNASPERVLAAAGATQASPEAAERPAQRAQDPLATAAVGPAATAGAAPTDRAAAIDQPASGAAPGTSPAEATALDAPATLVAAVDTAATPPAAAEDAPALVITFDVNSSYMPAGSGPQLRAFLESLPEAAPVQVELAAAVGSGAVRGASAEEAERYNAWMAERRAQRVAEWLEANARSRPITVTERLVENDPSREVRLHATIAR